MNRNKGLIILFLLVAGLLLLKLVFFPGGEEEGAQGPGKPGGPPQALSVEGYVVKYDSLNDALQVTGSILPNEEVELRPEISGKVEAIQLKEGEIAEKGALLVKLNDRDLLAQLRKITAQQKLAEARRSRLAELLKIQGVSQQEFDEADNQAEALHADADVLKVQIERTEIRAPFRGLVGLRSVSVGSYVTPADVIAGIRQMDPVKIEFSVPGRYAANINSGKEIQFSVEGEKEPRKGKVYAVESGINTDTRMLKIRATAANPDHRIKPGSFVKVDLILEKINDAILVPTQAVVPVLKGQQVYVAREGKATAIPVTTGIRNEKRVQITSGLEKGDTVVVTGVMSIRPGAGLRWTNFK